MKFNINFGRYQFAFSFNRKAVRSQKEAFLRLQVLVSQIIKKTKKRFAGRSANQILRQLFENKKMKKILGLNLTVIVLFSGLIAVPLSAVNTQPEAEIVALEPGEVKVTTESTFRQPLDSFRVTQGYHWFHRALDFGEKIGTPVYPVMEGTVEGVYHWRFAYGKHIVINHGAGYKSLYAHFSKITVEKGQKVDKNTVIGLIGSTGFSTGPHLHFELYDNGRALNPMTVFR